jgi:hypothetical protein
VRFLNPLRLVNQLGERQPQRLRNRFCHVQVWASFFAFQKPDISLVQASFFYQGCTYNGNTIDTNGEFPATPGGTGSKRRHSSIVPGIIIDYA